MKDIDVDALLGAMESDKVGSNAMSIMEMLETANKVMGQVTSLMDKFDKMGLKPLLVRGLGAKLEIDAETPLRSDDIIVPRTTGHAAVFQQLNGLSEGELRELFSDGAENQESVSNDE